MNPSQRPLPPAVRWVGRHSMPACGAKLTPAQSRDCYLKVSDRLVSESASGLMRPLLQAKCEFTKTHPFLTICGGRIPCISLDLFLEFRMRDGIKMNMHKTKRFRKGEFVFYGVGMAIYLWSTEWRAWICLFKVHHRVSKYRVSTEAWYHQQMAIRVTRVKDGDFVETSLWREEMK